MLEGGDLVKRQNVHAFMADQGNDEKSINGFIYHITLWDWAVKVGSQWDCLESLKLAELSCWQPNAAQASELQSQSH